MIIEDVATCLRYVPFSTKAPILVMLYTYPGVYQTQDKIGMRKTKFNGYYKSIDFYNPEYKDKALPEDFSYRRTIYWNPDVKTDIEGIAKISFYNNKTGERINIDAQTLTTNGRIGVNK